MDEVQAGKIVGDGCSSRDYRWVGLGCGGNGRTCRGGYQEFPGGDVGALDGRSPAPDGRPEVSWGLG